MSFEPSSIGKFNDSGEDGLLIKNCLFVISE